jgi:hypothetical protein
LSAPGISASSPAQDTTLTNRQLLKEAKIRRTNEMSNFGNEIYELLDYAIARCTNCYSLWDPYVYPGFPVPNVDVGEIWDTSEAVDDSLMDEENDFPDELEDTGEEDEEDDEVDFLDIDWEDQDAEDEEEFNDWDEEDKAEHEDDY